MFVTYRRFIISLGKNLIPVPSLILSNSTSFSLQTRWKRAIMAFVYINGYPGIGKLTVANELTKIVPSSEVIGNHSLIDPVARKYE